MKTAPRNPNSPRLRDYALRLSGRMVLRLLARIFGLKPCLMCQRWTRRYASRRIVLDGALPEGFEPLSAVLRADIKPPHQTIRIRREGLKMFAEPINNWIVKKGKMPELTDILSREFRGVQVKLRKDE